MLLPTQESGDKNRAPPSPSLTHRISISARASPHRWVLGMRGPTATFVKMPQQLLPPSPHQCVTKEPPPHLDEEQISKHIFVGFN